MPAYVAMLRGVNVGARNKLRMPDLEAACVAARCTRVVTYIQSGNVVCVHAAPSPSRLAAELESAIARELGLDVAVLVRSSAELARVVRGNPFLRAGGDPTKLHVTFCDRAPAAAGVRAAGGVDAGPDEFRVLGREVYLHCPHGYGRSKLANSFWERRLGVIATTRNWKTVTKLLELAAAR